MTAETTILDRPAAPVAGRLKLAEALPLDTPLSVHIDPTNACNFKCVFCPTGDPTLLKSAGRRIASLKLDDYKTMIDGMAAFPRPVKVLYLYKDGEPLLNKALAAMVAYARASGAVETVGITSNGALLTRERGVELIEAGLDSIRISVEHVSDAGYAKVTRKFDDYAMIVANVAALFEEKTRRGRPLQIHAKIIDVGLSAAEKQRFHDDFGPISDSRNIDSPMGWTDNAGIDWTLGQAVSTGMDGVSPLRDEIVVCPSPFKTLAINSNGDASVCCVDWSHDTSVGNALETSIVDIWNGPALRELRLTHLRGRRDAIEACRNCQYVKGMPADSILDDHAAALIGKFDR